RRRDVEGAPVREGLVRGARRRLHQREHRLDRRRGRVEARLSNEGRRRDVGSRQNARALHQSLPLRRRPARLRDRLLCLQAGGPMSARGLARIVAWLALAACTRDAPIDAAVAPKLDAGSNPEATCSPASATSFQPPAWTPPHAVENVCTAEEIDG